MKRLIFATAIIFMSGASAQPLAPIGSNDEESRGRRIDAWLDEQERPEREKKEAAARAEAEKRAAAKRAEAERQEAELRETCGPDYRNVRVGMTVARAQQCVGPFKLHGQTSRGDGTHIDDYRYCARRGCTFLSVINGVIAAWSTD